MNAENEEKTFEVFCTHCNLLTTAREVASYLNTTPENPLQATIDPSNTAYSTKLYSIALCGKCESVFLIESDFYEMPGEFCAPQGENVLYPNNQKISMSGIPKTIARAYTKASQSYQVGLYEPCVIMCRKCIEALCYEFGHNKGNLKSRLDSLQKSGSIDQKILNWADELRLIGNDAAHDLDIVIEQIDAQDALDFVEAIILYAFSLTRKFEQFIKRRDTKLEQEEK